MILDVLVFCLGALQDGRLDSWCNKEGFDEIWPKLININTFANACFGSVGKNAMWAGASIVLHRIDIKKLYF